MSRIAKGLTPPQFVGQHSTANISRLSAQYSPQPPQRMPKDRIKRKAKVKQGLRDPNKDRNDGVKKSHRSGKQTSRERWFSSWLKKGAASGKHTNKMANAGKKNAANKNPVAMNAHTIGKKRQREEQGQPKERRTAKERYCDTGSSASGKNKQAMILNAANAAKRSKNPLADKLPTESLSEFQTRKAKEQRAIIAKEEYNQTKRAGKSKKYHADKILKKKRKLQNKKNRGYDSEEDEWNAAAGASNTRAVAFGERNDDAPRMKNMPYKGRGKAQKKKVVTLLEEEGKVARGQDQMALLRARVVEAYRQSRGHHVMGPGSKGNDR